MAMNDPIADLLTRLRNASKAQHRFVDIPHSRTKMSILKVLQEQGFVDNFLVDEQGKKVRIFLKYSDKREPVLQGLRRISSPSLRRYVRYSDIPKIQGGMGITIISTPKGIVDGEKARALKVGGEMLCYAW